jgi:hypothetical protein
LRGVPVVGHVGDGALLGVEGVRGELLVAAHEQAQVLLLGGRELGLAELDEERQRGADQEHGRVKRPRSATASGQVKAATEPRYIRR